MHHLYMNERSYQDNYLHDFNHPRDAQKERQGNRKRRQHSTTCPRQLFMLHVWQNIEVENKPERTYSQRCNWLRLSPSWVASRHSGRSGLECGPEVTCVSFWYRNWPLPRCLVSFHVDLQKIVFCILRQYFTTQISIRGIRESWLVRFKFKAAALSMR